VFSTGYTEWSASYRSGIDFAEVEKRFREMDERSKFRPDPPKGGR
jgi:hypothetical protein